MFGAGSSLPHESLTAASTAVSATIDTAKSLMPSTPFSITNEAKTGISNLTASYSSLFFRTPSAKDLTQLPLRLAAHIDRTVFRTIPRYILASTGLGSWRDVADAAANTVGTGAGIEAAAAAGAERMANIGGDAAFPALGTAAATTAAAANGGWVAFLSEALQSSTFKSYWGMLHYLASRWAFTCFALSLIINRVNVYGASRRRIYLNWSKRLALRIVPLVLLFLQVRRLLQAIRCQTSPDFSLYRHGDNDKYSLLDWSTDGGPYHTIVSMILYGSTDEQACVAVGMARPSAKVRAKFGSFRLLWSTYLRLAFSHLIENLSCSLQQIAPMTEVGMTVFEHSLAFAEAETMISHTLGMGLFGDRAVNATATTNTTAQVISNMTAQATIPASGTILAIADATAAFTGPHLFDKINVPVEVLIVALLSCANALTSQVISLLNKQRQWRLINTGIWGVLFMSAFIWGFASTSIMVRSFDEDDERPVSSLLHFPTVAIIGFLPHMIVLLGMWICCNIYFVALLFTAWSLESNPNIPRPVSLRERVSIAHNNLQAAIQVRGITIRWYEDFYTALLRIGFAALTAASEAVFLNEGRSVEMRQFTWLEEERLDEIESSRNKKSTLSYGASQFQIVEEYGLPSSSPGGQDRGGVWQSGYSKERKIEQKVGQQESKDSFIYPTPRAGGVGAVQRTARFYLLFVYIRGIIFLLAGWIGFGLGAFLDRIGITHRPNWLRRIVGRSLKRASAQQSQVDRRLDLLEFWFLTDEGKLAGPPNEDVDIEPEMKKRVLLDTARDDVEEVLEKKMYDWWKAGGWFGTKDESGDYHPPQTDDIDDTTSVISMSTNASESSNDDGSEREWESESEGRRTPTQSSTAAEWSFGAMQSRESTPLSTDTPLDSETLARLLNPKTKEDREEAKIMALHLAPPSPFSSTCSNRIMTRSQYRREVENERARILLAGRIRSRKGNVKDADLHLPSISLYNTDTSYSTSSSASATATEPSARPLNSSEESEVLEFLILSRRKTLADANDDHEEDDHKLQGPACVVCQTSPRTIITWPCRCLCVCEDCRVSLAMNNFGTCVTCRRNVVGFVRLWVP